MRRAIALFHVCCIGFLAACHHHASSPSDAGADAAIGDAATDASAITDGGADGGGPMCQLQNPSSDPSSRFGAEVRILTNGNIVVTDPVLTVGSNVHAGAVYLFDGQTCALISKLTGSAPNEGVGASGIGVLTNGNFVVFSNYGAIDGSAAGFSATFVDGTTGFGTAGDTPSSSNSLLPAGVIATNATPVPCLTGQPALAANACQTVLEKQLTVDPSASSLAASGSRYAPLGLPPLTVDLDLFVALSNGDYLVASPGSNAMTVGSGTTGVHGVISAANSAIASDGVVGFGPDPGGILSPCFQVPAACGSAIYAASGLLPPLGVGGSATNLFSSIAVLPNGSFVTNASGAIVLHDATGATVGTLSGGTTKSVIVPLVGTNNYVVVTPDYGGGLGAVTLADGTTGLALKDQGASIGSTNSLVGASTSDAVGSGGATALAKGNFAVSSPKFGGGVGAVTWASGTTAMAATVGPGNSLVGVATSDAVGAITALSSGNYVVVSPQFGGGRGAATFGNGASGTPVGVVSVTNSLVGTASSDGLGSGGVVGLAKGAYVVLSPQLMNGAGAVTFGGASAGVTGIAGPTNSLVGSSTSDHVGKGASPFSPAVTPLTGGGYVVYTPGYASNVGAVTFGNGTTGVSGLVGASNSLVGGTASDGLASGSITALANGNYVVVSPNWSGGLGAVTFGSGTSGVSGMVSATNSLVGTAATDHVGSGVFLSAIVRERSGGATSVTFPPNASYARPSTSSYGAVPLASGHYVVMSPSWNGGVGAATYGGDAGVVGTISQANSLLGSVPGDHVSGGGVQPLPNGSYVVMSPLWSNGSAVAAGAVTFGGASGVVGPVSTTNSLVGAKAGDFVGFTGTNFLGGLPGTTTASSANIFQTLFANGGGSGNGASDLLQFGIGQPDGGVAGPSVVYGEVRVLSTGDYVVMSPYFDGELGAATFGSAASGVSGTVSAANSALGSVPHGYFGAFVEEGVKNHVWAASGLVEMAAKSSDVRITRLP